MSTPRIDMKQFNHLAPAVFTALRALGQAVADSGLEKSLIELVKVRASQINGCAYCTQFHINDARKLGVSQAQLDQLACWRDSLVFSAREAAGLAWTEALSRVAMEHVGEAVYAQLQAQFSESEIAFLTAAVANINAWNRICGPLLFTPPTSAAPAPQG
ncbi:MAG TPA: carboxymuconolactone decarboxylase family protein [Burkholderiaceae bacterium]